MIISVNKQKHKLEVFCNRKTQHKNSDCNIKENVKSWTKLTFAMHKQANVNYKKMGMIQQKKATRSVLTLGKSLSFEQKEHGLILQFLIIKI